MSQTKFPFSSNTQTKIPPQSPSHYNAIKPFFKGQNSNFTISHVKPIRPPQQTTSPELSPFLFLQIQKKKKKKKRVEKFRSTKSHIPPKKKLYKEKKTKPYFLNLSIFDFDGRFQSRSRNRCGGCVHNRVHLQCLPSRQLPAPWRCEPSLLPQIRRRFGALRRRHLHSDVTGRRGEPAGLPARDIQWRVQSHAPDEGSLARNLYSRRRARFLHYPLRYVLLRRRPGQVGTSRVSIIFILIRNLCW